MRKRRSHRMAERLVGSSSPRTAALLIPVELIVLRDGRQYRFSGDGQAVWQWAFVGNDRVALRPGPVHGSSPMHLELREIATGNLIAAIDVDPASLGNLPAWARGIAPNH
jgi:hypothetical protein